ncbi:MAG: sulfite exporter TauE/SafE family protein [Blastocatellia bacterium]|nr:sulfite exporter TauE/SafE family protein [Blastocatellia bacterium]MBL8195173.1 sulfite exporter TauE/SafE family protein [Blastocatellia bacterium]MBN8724827.1 sulfite exporter TauE/SafE family protein [Acidobacteriota bacterium]
MATSLVIGLLLSAAIGFSLGLIGGGGSIITVPVLVYVIGVSAHQAIGMSLAVVGTTSLIATFLHYKQKTVDLKIAAIFGITGMTGAYFGSGLTYLFSPTSLLFIFGSVMLVISLVMLLKDQKDISQNVSQNKLVKSIIAGLVVGLLTGFLGVGGGFLIVPALIFFAGLEIKNAIGTSLLIITINSLAGLIGHLQHTSFDLRLTILITVIAAIGTILGTKVAHQVSATTLKSGFATFVLVVAIFLIIKNYHFIF